MEKFIAPLRGRDYEQTAGRFINGMTAPIKVEAQRDEVRTMMRRGAQHVAVSEMESLQDTALWAEDQINVPVLMILAKQPAWTPEYEEFARKLVPTVDYRVWEGVSHFLMLDKPEEFNSAILEFVKKNALLKK
jgi:pimeloyl-ACP methyl ester carboxylesterase